MGLESDEIKGGTFALTFIISFIVLIILKIFKIATAPWLIIFIGGFFICAIIASLITIIVTLVLKVIEFIDDKFL